MTQKSSWSEFTRKLSNKIINPRFCGVFTKQEAEQKNMRLAVGEMFSPPLVKIRLYFLVDPWDGVIADARFSAYGPPVHLGLAEATCELVIRKNYEQARHISAELLDKQIRDKQHLEALSKQHYGAYNLLLEAVERAVEQCTDIPLGEEYIPAPIINLEEGRPYPGWEELSIKQKIAIIEEVISVDIRPYIELDAGGIEILSLADTGKLEIAYKGACTTCPSAVGSTLEAIQSILSAKVHPSIEVIPDRSFLG